MPIMNRMGKIKARFVHTLGMDSVPSTNLVEGQNHVVEASLTLIRERKKLKVELVCALGGSIATSCMLGVSLGHNSSFLQGLAFAPPRIQEAIWCGSTNSPVEKGKELKDPKVPTIVGDVLVQEM